MGKEVAVFMLFGQSNAVGHSLKMKEEDVIATPLKNVFGLRRDKNQSFDIEEVVFSGCTSGSMNLGETQDDTYSLANCLAKLWQAEIDNGNPQNLPDLYIVHIAIGAQGVFNMWHPDLAPRLKGGVLGVADISLYLFSAHILKLVEKYFEENGLTPTVSQIHWRGGEEDMLIPLSRLQAELKPLYDRIFNGLREAYRDTSTIVLHKLPFYDAARKNDEKFPEVDHIKTLDFINETFEEMTRTHSRTIVFDSKNAPHFDPKAKGYALTESDWVHYTQKTNEWVSKEIFDSYKSSLK